jgi:shikimate kinase
LAKTEKEFRQLYRANPNKNVHWLLEDTPGRLIWKQSQGNLETLRKYIDIQNPLSFPPHNLDNLLQQAQRQKVMLIADTAGMGKTTVLTHMSKQIKQKFPTHWVVRIDLNDHADVLKSQIKQKREAVEFLSEDLLKPDTDLEKNLFKQFLEVGKVVLILDGFDEISPVYKETVIDLLKALKQTSVEHLWVTTRPHLRDALEDNLQQLSYTIQPFPEANQVEFLTKFWSQKLSLEAANQERLEIYATALIKKLAQSISDEDKEFAGVPLQTRMLAEAFGKELKTFYQSGKSNPDLPDTLNLLELYKRFIDRKYDIYQEEKAKTMGHNVAATDQRERDYENIRKRHQLLALQVLRIEKHVDIFEVNSEFPFQDEKLARICILQYIGNKPVFIHRTFAEYYAADFLVNQLTKKINPSSEVQGFLLQEIFLKKPYQVIGTFIDRLLEECKPLTDTVKDYGKQIHEIWKKRSQKIGDESILHRAVTEGNAHIVGFLLESLKAGENYIDTLKEMFLAKYWGQTIWHLAAERGHAETLDKLWAWGKEVRLFSQDSKDLLLHKDKYGRSVWHLAAGKGHVEILQKL